MFIPFFITLVFLIPLVIEDWRTKLLSDHWLYGLVGAGLVYSALVTGTGLGYLEVIGIALMVILCSIILERFGIMGEGDGWLLAGIFILNGAAGLLFTILFADVGYFGFKFIRNENKAQPFVPFILVGFILWGVLYALLGLWK